MRKKKNPLPTPKEREDFELQRLREEYTNEPTIFYKVGDEVDHGHIKKSTVTEILDNGKILKLHEIVTNINYGNPFDSERDMYVSWHSVAPRKNWDGKSYIMKEERFRLNYYQSGLLHILGRVYHFGLDMSPEYQRGFVWDQDDKTKLIDSIFDEVDIGKFVFRKLPFKPHPAPAYEIVDGKQRVSTIVDFYEGRFKWRGKIFRDLHPRDRSYFQFYSISVADLAEDANRDYILKVFLRLNTCGRPPDPKEMERVRKLLESGDPIS